MEVFRWVRVLGAGRSTVFPKAAVHFPILLQAGRCDTSCASERIAGRMRNRMRGQSNSRCRLASAIEVPQRRNGSVTLSQFALRRLKSP
jgi:hypothetical protein